MCGIAGYLHFDADRPVDRANLKAMTDCITHRGPDSEGHFVDKNVGLGHRRLSIIDVHNGIQPMFSDDGSIAIVFNGEIYNYVELKLELQARGRTFKTASDTEVIIKAYQEWGMACQNKFNGMWAFALWDRTTQELFLSRDRIGEKPLNYAVFENTFVFGSEIKSILKYGVPAIVNTELIELYLFLTYIPTPNTFYKNVYKLKPGHFLRVHNGMVVESKYWDVPIINEKELLRNRKMVQERFEELFVDAVNLRMRSDVPFGAFLSGGLDSSSVVATMAQLSKIPVETFTIGFKDRAFDESFLAKLVADQFKTRHHIHTVEPASFSSAREKAVFHFDEPFGDSSAIPTGFVSGFAAQHVKMVLTGDGGDEVLSGYNAYLGLKITEYYRMLPGKVQQALPVMLRSLAAQTSHNLRYKLNRMANVADTARLPFNERMVRKMAYTDYSTIKAMVGDQKVIKIDDFISDFFSGYPIEGDFYKMMYFDFKHSLPDDYLVKVDRMSMASSIEARVPFLDHRLIEFMVGVDKSVKLKGWKTKTVLRNTIAKQLPPQLLKAPKRGFGIPLREWFKSDSFGKHFDELKTIGFLNQDIVSQIIAENKTGKKDNGNFIWTLFILKEFLNKNVNATL